MFHVNDDYNGTNIVYLSRFYYIWEKLNLMNSLRSFAIVATALALAACSGREQTRNIALHRAAYHSSAADYNYTAQLVTDGIVDDALPSGYEVLENGVRAPRHRKESIFSGRRAVHFKEPGPHCEIDILERRFHQDVDAVKLNVAAEFKDGVSGKADIRILATSDGGSCWKVVAEERGMVLKDKVETKLSLDFSPDCARNGYRLVLDGDEVQQWTILAWDFYCNGERINVLGNERFQSIWCAEDCGPQWLRIDLGAKSKLSGAVFHWNNRPPSGAVFVSDDCVKWKEAGRFGPSGSTACKDTVRLRGRGRFVKVEMDATENGMPAVLSELEISGSNRIRLPESNWKLARASEASDPSAWIPAEVPGTVLSSFTAIGAVPDISYGKDQEYISDSYFNSDFIYRGVLPFAGPAGRRVWLDFGGVNWKAEVSMNGVELGKVDGAFTRASFDVTDVVREGDNELEVLVRRPANPGAAKGFTLKRIPPNGGILGADNPTFHASVGWDWIPTVRGRNTGIWREVAFRTCGDVSVSDPLVQTVLNLPDTTSAEVSLEALLQNHSSETRNILWEGSLGPVAFAEPLTLAPGESRAVRTLLIIDNPRLWWPNGYGEAYLYDACMRVRDDSCILDSLSFKAGLRQMTYSTEGGRLTAFVNGRRVSGRGGNWGFSELNLRYTAREYDIAAGYHRQMNFNMIRNWVGQTADEEFYEACDRHGIMVWQDFWLANPTDGPDPDDDAMFMANAEDYVRNIRRHPSVVLYCGRNEGMPPASLDASLRSLVARLHGDICYIPNSAADLVSGLGPYNRLPSSRYFSLWGQDRMHSERGATNFPNYESIVRFIPEDALWPMNDLWGIHDFAFENAQKCGLFNEAVVSRFGEPSGLEEYCRLAQWVNYDEFRAVFESRSACRRGLLLWMSHTAWPSLVWSPYDYYFDPDASFFACKHACEAIHIQYNAATSCVEVVNMSAGDRTGLSASAVLTDMYGRELRRFDFALDSPEDSTVGGPSVLIPEGGVSYLQLCLKNSEDGVLSENFYVLGSPEDDLRALNNLPEASVDCRWKLIETEDEYVVRAELENTSDVPALMIRLSLLNSSPVNSGPVPAGLCTSSVPADDYRILPADYTDNYFHLMPGESRKLTIRVAKRHFDMPLRPRLAVSGFNLR